MFCKRPISLVILVPKVLLQKRMLMYKKTAHLFQLLSPEDINYDDAACSKFKEDKYQDSSNALFCKSRKVLNTEAVIS